MGAQNDIGRVDPCILPLFLHHGNVLDAGFLSLLSQHIGHAFGGLHGDQALASERDR